VALGHAAGDACGGLETFPNPGIASIASTVFEVVVRGTDPAELEAPAALLPSRTTR
jgi:hypothetical protein